MSLTCLETRKAMVSNVPTNTTNERSSITNATQHSAMFHCMARTVGLHRSHPVTQLFLPQQLLTN